MGLMARVVTGTVVAALVVAGGYAWADANDYVPGVLTTGPEPAAPAPFPTAPAATQGGPLQETLPTLDPEAPRPSDAAVQRAVDALVADPAMGPSTGVVVADALTGSVIAAASPDQARVPASIQKILTAAAALTTVGSERVLTTTVTESSLGALTLVGAGDMMLAPGAGDPDAVYGRAGVADLADQVAQAYSLNGVTSVTLTLDDTLFTGSPTGAWAEDVPTLGYAAAVSALAVNTGRTTDAEYAPRQTDPAMSAAQTFVAALAERGITVEGKVSRGTSPRDAKVIASVDSAPVGEIVEYFLHTSDNTITEVVGRLVAIEAGLPASFEGATRSVLEALARQGIDTTGMTLVDCSGLADGSRASAASFAEVLDLMTGPNQPQLRLGVIGLPIAGLDGTLADRFTTSGAAGLVRAKTGSLPHVTSLAGTAMTADGRQLTFVVMADQTPDGGQWAPRKAIDGFVAGLADCGCTS